jgi:hypothetical protein
MRRDELYLVDMIEAAVAATTFVQDVDEATFLESDLFQSAVLQKLLVIGEAAGRVSPEIRERWPGLPWRSVSGFRNIAARGRGAGLALPGRLEPYSHPYSQARGRRPTGADDGGRGPGCEQDRRMSVDGHGRRGPIL